MSENEKKIDFFFAKAEKNIILSTNFTQLKKKHIYMYSSWIFTILYQLKKLFNFYLPPYLKIEFNYYNIIKLKIYYFYYIHYSKFQLNFTSWYQLKSISFYCSHFVSSILYNWKRKYYFNYFSLLKMSVQLFKLISPKNKLIFLLPPYSKAVFIFTLS